MSKEVVALTEDPPEGIKVFLNEEDITDIQATIEGPGTYISTVTVHIDPKFMNHLPVAVELSNPDTLGPTF